MTAADALVIYAYVLEEDEQKVRLACPALALLVPVRDLASLEPVESIHHGVDGPPVARVAFRAGGRFLDVAPCEDALPPSRPIATSFARVTRAGKRWTVLSSERFAALERKHLASLGFGPRDPDPEPSP